VIQAVEDMGKLDNTLIIYIYISGDNGTSAEGSTIGTPFDMAAIQGIDVPVAEQLKFYDAWGSPLTTPHMSVAWSWAFDTSFKWTKQVASHFGGTRQGMVMAWPNRIKDAGGIRSQFHHLIDIVPTILEATGVPAPAMLNGIAQEPIEGVSMVYTWDKANANAASRRTTQYFEMMGNRTIYHDGWIACTTPPQPPWLMGLAKMPDVVNGYKWELYNIAEDYSEFNDLAGKMPDKLRQMQELFLVEAAKYNVFPLDNDVLRRVLTPKPSYTAGRTLFTYSGEISGLPNSDAPNLLVKSYTITAEVEVPAGGAEGMILTSGGRFVGYGFYLLKGKPVFLWNLVDLERIKWEGPEALSLGRHTVEFDFKYESIGVGTLEYNNFSGLGQPGTGTLKVDGKVVDTKRMEKTIPIIVQWDESFDIGAPTRSPASTTPTTSRRSR
jgi:hypothetical protein